jgi:hypothetical protein
VNLEQLIEALKELRDSKGAVDAHRTADEYLLEFINDKRVDAVFDAITKPYG